MKLKKEDMVLYLVTNRNWLGNETLYQQVEKALSGGVTMVQLREKELDEAIFLAEAIELKKLCRKHRVPFLINDNVEIAVKADADGVHVGQSDMDPKKVRTKIGPDKILGVTAKTVEQAKKAELGGADYIGSGAVFDTGTKKDTRLLDHAVLQQICESVSIPVVAIGGVTADNVLKLANRKISGIATVSGILAQPDITKAAKTLRALVKTIVKQPEAEESY